MMVERHAIHFLLSALTKEVDHIVIQYLTLLVVRQLMNVVLQDILRSCW